MRFTFYRGGKVISTIFAENVSSAIQSFINLGFDAEHFDELKIE